VVSRGCGFVWSVRFLPCCRPGSASTELDRSFGRTEQGGRGRYPTRGTTDVIAIACGPSRAVTAVAARVGAGKTRRCDYRADATRSKWDRILTDELQKKTRPQ